MPDLYRSWVQRKSKGSHGCFETGFFGYEPCRRHPSRRLGGSGLGLVAAGRYDGYWEFGLGVYDVAAGYLIVKEAGGFVSPLEKGKDPVQSAALIASNAEIHDKLVKNAS